MNTIKLLGIRDLKTDQEISANIDYGIVLIASRLSKEIPDSFEEEESKDDIIYKMKVSQVDAVYDLKEKQPIEFEHGKTISQKIRWRIEQNLGKEEYNAMGNYILSRIDELCEDYREKI